MNRITFILLIASLAMAFMACEKEDDVVAKPQITIMELGDGDSHGNDHTATIGGDLHMDIEVIAEGKIDIIQVILHPEGEHEEAEGHEAWEIDTIYTKFSGLKNADFHEHLKIDTVAEAGHYHFDFIVTDMEGNQSSVDAAIELMEE